MDFDILETGGRSAVDEDMIDVPGLAGIGAIGIEGDLAPSLVGKPSMAHT